MDEKLKKCPFCGSHDVKVITGIRVTVAHNMVQCNYCRCTVSFEDRISRVDCINGWNRRN